MTIDEKYKKAGEIISTAGGTPLPVNDTLIKLLKFFIMEDELDFIAAFAEKKSQTMEQLKQSSGLSEDEINKKDLKNWLKLGKERQWDYKNIDKRKGVLVKLTDF